MLAECAATMAWHCSRGCWWLRAQSRFACQAEGRATADQLCNRLLPGTAALRALPPLGPAGCQLCSRGSLFRGGGSGLARQPQGGTLGAAHPVLHFIAGPHVWQVSAEAGRSWRWGCSKQRRAGFANAAELGALRMAVRQLLTCDGPVPHCSWSQHIFIDPSNPRDSYCLTYNCAGEVWLGRAWLVWSVLHQLGAYAAHTGICSWSPARPNQQCDVFACQTNKPARRREEQSRELQRRLSHLLLVNRLHSFAPSAGHPCVQA